MNVIDALLNRITMYRLVLYYLLTLEGAAIVLSFFGLLNIATPWELLFLAVLSTAVCWSLNKMFAWMLNAPSNPESTYITALILALIVGPASLGGGAIFLVLSGVIAIASKYLLAFKNKHIFNPAAFGVAAASLFGWGAASWWVGGNLPLLPFVLIGGLLLVRKLQRFDLVLSFIIVAVVATSFSSGFTNLYTGVSLVLIHTSLLFFAFVMLTEPLTTPPTRKLRVIYGAIIGLLFAPALLPHLLTSLPLVAFGGFFMTPELALVAGNLFSFFLSPKGRLRLTLARVERTSPTTSDFVFRSDRLFPFKPGQYMEWTLPHAHADARGSRRYFTIASAPTQPELRLGVKFYDPPSSFKRTLANLRAGAMVSAGEVRGDFTLPTDLNQKLVFIAGGIGITPFRSMIEHLLDRKEKRPIILFYSVRTGIDIAYRELFDRAERELGMTIIYTVSDESPTKGLIQGPLNKEHLQQYAPDFTDRLFYLSGPRGMVVGFERILKELHVPRWHIKTDFFPGFV